MAGVSHGSSAQLVAFAPVPERQFAEQTPDRLPASAYHDVVFHPKPALEKPVLYTDLVSRKESVSIKQSSERKAAKKPMHRSLSPAGSIQSLVIVTSWESPSGQGASVTMIEGVVPISDLSAVRAQAGWYVVQL